MLIFDWFLDYLTVLFQVQNYVVLNECQNDSEF